jgi:cell division protein FtsZ
MAAAEAAIANPLLDETSMKGAQGLLISITGGRDMTLFEVDEAATRIREEVDPDANIILGATFDEDLEGLIRVSVVATGIDKSAAEIGGRVETQRTDARSVHRVVAPQPQQGQPRAAAPAAAPAAAVREPVSEQALTASLKVAEAEIERELRIEPAVAEDFVPQSRLFANAQPAEAQPQRPVAGYHVPPTRPAEAPAPAAVAPETLRAEAMEPARMPRVEDFPPVVQAEIEHRQAPRSEPAADERGPMGLLKRLSNSLGRREEEAPRTEPKAPAAEDRRQLSPEASLYAPRRGQLDDQGRTVTAKRMPQDDDQLEIPAFLRRQAN